MQQEIQTALSALPQDDIRSAPILFDMGDIKSRDAFLELVQSKRVFRVCDEYVEQQRELFFVRNPSLVFDPSGEDQFQHHLRSLQEETSLELHGVWVYFPWSGVLSHILPEEDFYLVHTARNAHLITPEEQKIFKQATIAVAGMSIGSSIVFTLCMQGVGGTLKLADMDTLALSNTNRILAGTGELGAPKVWMVARRVWEMNPYVQVEIFEEGLTEASITAFFEHTQVVVDEVDSLEAKVRLRHEAQRRRVPVVMAADCGESSILDVERYDLDANIPLFHGRLGDITLESVQHLQKKQIGKLIATQVGVKNHSERMLRSLTEMGRSIVSWPQLGSTALLNAAAISFCVRHIVTGAPLFSDRVIISLESMLDPQWADEDAHSRKEIEAKFKAMFDIL